MTRALAASDLVGTWRLRTWQLTTPDGAIEQPFGDDPEGYVVYTADGHMITVVSEAGRLADSPLYHGYAGTYRVEGREVVHHVEVSFLPDWVGSEQRRHIDLDPDHRSLTLSTPPVAVGGKAGRHALTWERVTD